MPGLPGGTAIAIELVANTVGSAAAPASTTCCMVVGLAEAKTSAGAPETIWVASAELAAKLKVTVAPGLASSNCSPRRVNDSVSEAAAKHRDRPGDAPTAEPPGWTRSRPVSRPRTRQDG